MAALTVHIKKTIPGWKTGQVIVPDSQKACPLLIGGRHMDKADPVLAAVDVPDGHVAGRIGTQIVDQMLDESRFPGADGAGHQ